MGDENGQRISDYRPAAVFIEMGKLASEQRSTRREVQELGKEVKTLRELVPPLLPRLSAVEQRLDNRSKVTTAIGVACVSPVLAAIFGVAAWYHRPPAQDLTPLMTAIKNVDAKVDAATKTPESVEVTEKQPEPRARPARARRVRPREKSSELQVAEKLRDLHASDVLAERLFNPERFKSPDKE